MLQLGQNSTLNQTTHRFVAHSARNYGYRASFRCCHLTSISQCYYHACAQNDGQLILFDQLCSNKAVAGTTINQSYNILVIRPTIPLYNRVVSLGLALLGAVHEHPKNRNNFCAQAHFLALSIQAHATI